MKITLIGMSGAGKSLVGKELSKVLKYQFIDINKIIEKKYNKTLQKLIEEIGKKKFLKLEEETVLEINKTHDLVIASGGSVVYSEKAINYLKKISKIVFLDVPLNEIKKRIQDFSKRGIAGLEDGLEKVFEERYQLYKKYADITIKIQENFDLNMIINTIIKNLKKKSILNK
jgi:shikimate kinase